MTQIECEYNNSCYETAKNGDYIEYNWNVTDTLESEFVVSYSIDGSEREINVCEGCKGDIEQNCEELDNYEWNYERRIRPQTESYDHRRSVRNHYKIQHPWTLKERNTWIKNWHKKYPHLCKGSNGKCNEECYK